MALGASLIGRALNRGLGKVRTNAAWFGAGRNWVGRNPTYAAYGAGALAGAGYGIMSDNTGMIEGALWGAGLVHGGGALLAGRRAYQTAARGAKLFNGTKSFSPAAIGANRAVSELTFGMVPRLFGKAAKGVATNAMSKGYQPSKRFRKAMGTSLRRDLRRERYPKRGRLSNFFQGDLKEGSLGLRAARGGVAWATGVAAMGGTLAALL